jgi:para-nitrobenzyl esterase
MGTIVTTTNGRLQGAPRDGHEAFLGIPFAAPPVDDLRFQAPMPAIPWQDIRPASEFGPACPQPDSALPGMAPGPQEEAGCLTLNVYTPDAGSGARPVLVWIHGGACTTGSNRQLMYDGGPLARRGDVVVVALNYRLGVLGWLNPGLDGSDFAPNVGLQDQIAGLCWVQENIANFGGDPENVTIFGESAGGMSVTTLMATPSAGGLFHKVIAQSGAAQATLSPAQAAEAGDVLAAELGLAQLEASSLRERPIEDLLAAQLKVTARLQANRVMPWAPVVDGSIVPEHPRLAVSAGKAGNIPLLIGSTADEWRLFTIAMPHHRSMDRAALRKRLQQRLSGIGKGDADEVLALYPHPEPWQVFDAIETDRVFWMPAIQLAEAQQAHQTSTYMYRFSWPSPAVRGMLGACHAVELPFVFGTLDAPGMDRFSGTGPAAEALALQVMDSWIAFARAGDPSHPGLPDWAPYEPSRRLTMDFAEVSIASDAPLEERRSLWAEILED